MDIYDIDIRDELVAAAEAAGVRLIPGWFPEEPLPCACFYQKGAAASSYFSNKPTAVRLNYSFQVRALTESEKEETAKRLCNALGALYSARRGQYDDGFDEGQYVKQIGFTFTV